MRFTSFTIEVRLDPTDYLISICTAAMSVDSYATHEWIDKGSHEFCPACKMISCAMLGTIRAQEDLTCNERQMKDILT